MIKKHICVWTVILLGVLLLLPVLPVFSSDVSDADFYGVIQTTNNSTAATQVITTITGMNTTALIAGGFLNSSANNCAIQSTTSADIRFSPGYGNNPWVMYNGAVGANTIINSLFYTKDVTGGAIRYSPGDTGMTVPDGMTEPANQFEIDMTGIFPVLSAAGSTTPTIRAQNNGVGTAAAVPVAMPAGWTSGDLLIVLIDLYDAGAAGSPVITTPAGWTQRWHTAESAIKRYACYTKTATGAEANPTNFTIDRNCYYAFRSIAITTGTWNQIAVGVSSTGAASNPDPPVSGTLTSATNNLFIASCGQMTNMASAPANYGDLQTQTQNSAGISIATREYDSVSDNPGTFGTSTVAWASNTIAIENIGSNPIISHWDATNGGIVVYSSSTDEITVATLGAGATSFTVSGLTETEYDHFTLTLSGGTLSLTVGTSSNSTAFAGAIPNSTSDWIFCDGDAVLYVDTISYDQGGVPVSAWPVSEYGLTCVDTIGANDGTKSVRATSSDPDVSSELILFQPVTEPTAPPFAVGEGPAFISGNITATETPNPVSGNGSLKYPGKDFIDAMGAAGDFPEVWLPTFIAVFVLLALSVTASYFLKESGAISLFVKSVVNIVGYGVLVSLNIFDWWMLIFFFIFEQAIWFAAKERRE